VEQSVYRNLFIASFGAFTAVMYEVFGVVTPCGVVMGCQRFGCLHLHPEDGGSIDLRNDGIPSQHYTASQSRRPWLETSPPWKPPKSH